jgi:Leucine-rich repeat (LRR) protein
MVDRNLSGYDLTGPISPSFVQLTNLTSLALDNNSLSGSLPNFSNFLHLIDLNLSDNQLSGSIPPSIWGIFNLSVLDLSQNQLYGNLIPTHMETPCPTSLTKL